MPRGKFERTPEYLEKLSAAKKGKPSGKPKDPEKEQERMRKMLETKKKNGTLSHPSMIQSGRKMGERNKGRKHSQESKDKMSSVRSGKTYEEIYGQDAEKQKSLRSNSNRGKKRSLTIRNNISRARIEYYKSLSDEEKFDKLKHWIKAGMDASGSRLSDTKLELAVETMIQSKGFICDVDYFKQYEIGRCFVDFCFPEEKIIIEAQGCYSHQCAQCGFNQGAYGESAAERRERDARRKQFLESQGYKVIEIWEHQING